MNVGLFVKPETDPGCAYTREVKNFLKERGHSVTLEDELKKADFWVVLGGDGTMLRAARYAAPWGIPLLGINLGNVGFLTDVKRNEGLSAIERVLAGAFAVQKRMMLAAADGLALNDIVVKGNGLTRFTVNMGDENIYEVRADGIIFATPTGSTAYNLSAGGPLMMPESDMFAVTCICPNHSLTRSWVLDGAACLEVMADREVSLFLDGEKGLPLSSRKKMAIKRADCTALIIKTGGNNPK
jgi:NAD+ kinase